MSTVRALLRSTLPPGLVQFDFNPEEISVRRSADLRHQPSASSAGGTPAGSSGSIFRGAKPSTITLGKVVLHGRDTKSRCDQLLNWMSPGGGLLGALGGAALSAATGGALNLTTSTPTVTFQWGPPVLGFVYDVKVASATISYTRFTSAGVPVRAVVALTLQEQPSLLSTMPTNPTSGGLPGRRAHRVSEGESLVGIATAQYGSPGRWRQLAASNAVDDPMRVRAGDVVLLPNPDELPDGRR